MSLASNPFVVLSYVSGPALLTNASSLLLLSTANRFARAVDRSRALVERFTPPPANLESRADYQELFEVRRRVRQIALALSGLYLAVAAFGLATLLSVGGAVLAESVAGPTLDGIVAAAAVSGLIGFAGFVTAGVVLVIESRLATKSLVRETDEAVAILDAALRAMPNPKSKS